MFFTEASPFLYCLRSNFSDFDFWISYLTKNPVNWDMQRKLPFQRREKLGDDQIDFHIFYINVFSDKKISLNWKPILHLLRFVRSSKDQDWDYLPSIYSVNFTKKRIKDSHAARWKSDRFYLHPENSGNCRHQKRRNEANVRFTICRKKRHVLSRKK